jgi:hypothetical protein
MEKYMLRNPMMDAGQRRNSYQLYYYYFLSAVGF